MIEETKKNLEEIAGKLHELPTDIANAAIEQYAARMEGFAEGFAAGKAHAAKLESASEPGAPDV